MRQVNTLINNSLVQSSFSESFINPVSLLWYILLHAHTYLYLCLSLSWTLSPGLLLDDRCWEFSNSYPSTRRVFISYQVFLYIGVSCWFVSTPSVFQQKNRPRKKIGRDNTWERLFCYNIVVYLHIDHFCIGITPLMSYSYQESSNLYYLKFSFQLLKPDLRRVL